MNECKRYSIVYANRKILIGDNFYKSYAEIHKKLFKGESITVAIDYLFEGKWHCEGYRQIGKDSDGICWTQRSLAHDY
jgi:hypothetical protein